MNSDDNTLKPRVLVVDDDDELREITKEVLESSGFRVVEASSVRTALELIPLAQFDAVLTDLHMPRNGDGLTVISAVRHFNPEAATLVLTGFPEMHEAAAAVLAQADGILVKPYAPRSLIDTLWDSLKKGRAVPPHPVTVATILEEETLATIAGWLVRVHDNSNVLAVAMEDHDRSSHLPQLFKDLEVRLRSPRPLSSHAVECQGAIAHGLLRRQQGYTAAMMVEESRMLQVSIFQTLQNNLFRVNFSRVLESVMVIADKVDSQLAQAMSGYVTVSKIDTLPTVA